MSNISLTEEPIFTDKDLLFIFASYTCRDFSNEFSMVKLPRRDSHLVEVASREKRFVNSDQYGMDRLSTSFIFVGDVLSIKKDTVSIKIDFHFIVFNNINDSKVIDNLTMEDIKSIEIKTTKGNIRKDLNESIAYSVYLELLKVYESADDRLKKLLIEHVKRNMVSILYKKLEKKRKDLFLGLNLYCYNKMDSKFYYIKINTDRLQSDPSREDPNFEEDLRAEISVHDVTRNAISERCLPCRHIDIVFRTSELSEEDKLIKHSYRNKDTMMFYYCNRDIIFKSLMEKIFLTKFYI